MRLLRRLGHGRRGSTAAEFAIVVPLLTFALFACLQFGTLFFAQAGLRNAVGEGARMATLWPRRSEAEIEARVRAAEFGLNPEGLSGPAFTYGRAGGQDYVEIRLTYVTTLDFLLFRVPDVRLTEERRAYLP